MNKGTLRVRATAFRPFTPSGVHGCTCHINATRFSKEQILKKTLIQLTEIVNQPYTRMNILIKRRSRLEEKWISYQSLENLIGKFPRNLGLRQ